MQVCVVFYIFFDLSMALLSWCLLFWAKFKPPYQWYGKTQVTYTNVSYTSIENYIHALKQYSMVLKWRGIKKTYSEGATNCMSSILVILAGTANMQIISLRLSPVDNDVISLKRNRMHFIGFGLSQGVVKVSDPTTNRSHHQKERLNILNPILI